MNDETFARRARLAAACLVLTAIAFIQAPGRIVADTKLDLVVDPASFLQRALSMWDPQGFFGQVQNQAYGYLFPMGPFFWIGDLVQLEPWVTQRLWWALVWSVAFLGVVKLSEVMGIGTPLIRIFAGLAFALSPRFLTVIGPSSIEVWPSALAPWVLVPLVISVQRGSPRRLAALSALAVAVVGGVNAVATFAVIPLAALWLLLAPRSPRRRSMMLWWPPFVLLGTLWWLLPLFLLGKYSPPFLDYIESSSITTRAATMFDALRGTSSWVPYISNQVDAGKVLLQDPVVIVNAGVLLMLGIIGLTMRDLPHRRFLFAGLMTGLVLVTMGHVGTVDGWAAGSVQDVLDGALAPLRNTHKFDVVLRLPLILASAHALAVLRRRTISERETTVRRAAVALIAVTALAGASVPAWTGQIANRDSFIAIPAYWEQAAGWLDDNTSSDDGTALMVPSSAFADYVWGSTGDEPMQALSESAWAVRNSVPLTPSGTIRVLDSITNEMAQGRGSVGLATTLRRAGVEFLVIRNDLRADIAGGRTEALYQTLEGSDDIAEAASFGPNLGGAPSIDLDTERSFANGGWQSSHPAVDIFRIGPGPDVRVMDEENTPTLVGGSDTMATLDNLGVTDGGSVFLAGDRPRSAAGSPLIVTDGLRRQEVAFGSVDELRSASLTPDEPYTLERRRQDYIDPADARWLSVPRLLGAVSLEASSTRAAASTSGGVQTDAHPWSAFDGDQRSTWRATSSTGWIRLELGESRDLGTVTIRPGLAPAVRQRLTVTTEDGPRTLTASGTAPLKVDVGWVDRVEIRGTNLVGDDFEVADVTSPALKVSRPLVLPRTPDSWGLADTMVLGADQTHRPGCLDVKAIARCRAGVQDLGEDSVRVDRVVGSADNARYGVSVRTRMLAGDSYDGFAQRNLDAQITASSTINADVRSSVSRLADGDSRTGWIADSSDANPTITVRWPEPRLVRSIQARTSSQLPASTPRAITLELDDGTQRSANINRGVARFATGRTQTLTIRLGSSKDATDFQGDLFGTKLPIGISELGFNDAARTSQKDPSEIVELPCGTGPSVTVNGLRYPTSVTATRGDLDAGRDVPALLCDTDTDTDTDTDSIAIGAGSNRITVTASPLLAAGTTVLKRLSTPAPIEGTGGASFVLDRHNFNDGWTATSGGQKLTPVRLNGWQQGWVVPAGLRPADISTEYAPAPAYRAVLTIGLLTLLSLFGICLLPGREGRDGGEGRNPSRRRVGPAVGAIATGLSLGLVGGTAAVLLGGLGAVVAWRLAQRGVPTGWVAVAPLLVSLGSYVIGPWGTSADWAGTWYLPQWCVAVALGAVAFAVFQRRNGISTKR